METRPLAALVSSLVSQALLLFFQANPNILLPSPLSLTMPSLLGLLTSCNIAATVSISTANLPRPRKRRREIDGLGENEEEGDEDKEEERESHEIIEEAIPGSAVPAFAPHPNPDHFKLQFGMRSSTFEWLTSLLDPLIDSRDPVGSSFRLPTATRLALGLSRLATGASYADLASRYSVPELAARFCARNLCRVLCTNFRFWLGFPKTPEELHPVSAGFASLAGLPGCCGAIASARFNLQSGPASAFVVADVSSRILSFVAMFRGDPPAFELLTKSTLYKKAVEGHLLGPEQYLVGDEGHHLFPWLMVPFVKPVPGSCEEDFNLALQMMCWPARRAIYSLHNWKVLSRLEEEASKVAVAFIGTCAILHNVLLMNDDESALADVGDECLLSSVQYKDEEKPAAVQKAVLLRNTLAMKARESEVL
ncbi:hypothetical protein KSP39_PZI003705 [Platanthera zijinensis]|uniref:DDE Tnp4 domain-containing protein n=1 Tax=Platanthera zijinensis TaxID=2320716 RepID=A0AAP0GC47_9ASPA